MGSKRLIVAFVALAAIPAGCGTETSGTILPTELADVVAVVDGDTIRLTRGRRVRLLQIDAPETGECYASAASAALARAVGPTMRVALARDPELDSRDEHGRLLRYVLTRGQTEDVNVNVRLVRTGAAVPYFFRGARGVHAADLLEAVEEARGEHRGLWGACPSARLDPNLGSLTGPA